MTARTVGYWACTAMIALSFTSSGVAHLMRAPQVMEGIAGHLGYPAHFVVLLGAWKVLGGVVITLPGLARLKEWAYAGIVFDLTGAAVAHAAMKSDARHVVTPLVLAAIALASWALRPAGRTLANAPALEPERDGAG